MRKTDSTVLLAKVRMYCEEHDLTVAQFCDVAVADMDDLSAKTLYNAIFGHNYCSKRSADAIGKMLGIPATTVMGYVKKNTGRKKKRNYNRPLTAVVGAAYSDDLYFDMKAFAEYVRNSEYSQASLCKAVGISHATPSNWSKKFSWNAFTKKGVEDICKLLGVRTEDLVKSRVGAQDASDVSLPSGYRDIRDIPVGQVGKIFEIMNSNILLLAKEVQELKQSTTVNRDLVNSCMDKLNTYLDGIVNASITVVNPLADVLDAKDELPDKVKNPADDISVDDYDPKDSYEVYRNKLNNMAHILALAEGLTHKQELTKLYKDMTKVYGVVYDQLERDFRQEHHRSSSCSMELLYDNELFREIFFATTVDKVHAACK